MKILHVISSSGLYGAEAVILNLARALRGTPHVCVLGVFYNAANPNRQLYDAALREGIETHLIPCAGQFDRSTLASLRALGGAVRPDLVHAHGYKADIYCYMALRKLLPLVSTCHTWYDTDRMVTVYGKVDRLVLRAFSQVVAVSEEVRQRLLSAGVRSERINLVQNGIDLHPFAAATPSLRAGLSPDELLVGLVGRLAWEKGIDIFLIAAAKVLQSCPRTRFVVIGEGPDRQTLEEQIDALGIGGSAALVGRRNDMASVYASFDVMVSASRQEGLPMALLEGMASGIPIVASAVGEVPTIIRNGYNGLIVPPEDASALEAAILSLLNNQSLRSQFSTATRALVAAEFSADRMAADYLRVYDRAISGNAFRFRSRSRTAAGSQPQDRKTKAEPGRRRSGVFMMDMLATVPYYTAYLSRALLDQGEEVQVGSITYYLDRTCFSSRGLRTHPGVLDIVGRFNLPQSGRRVLKLMELAVNLMALSLRFLVRSPDTVHVQFLPLLTWRFPLDLWFVRFCQLRGCRIVLTVHDLLPHDTGFLHKRAFHELYARVDALICHSASIRDRLISEFSVPAAKISVIPHGPFFYDLPDATDQQNLRSLSIPDGKDIVLWQGILMPYKGVDLLLEAWQYVEDRLPNSWLVIAGTGQPGILEQTREQVARLGLRNIGLDFRFISAEQLVALYRAAKVVAYPYRAITTSGALATGLALGKAIVATDLPVFRELLTDRRNALLVPSPDLSQGNHEASSAAALGHALVEILEDDALRSQLAANVRAMHFGDEMWQSIAKQTLAVYNQAI